MEIVYKSPPADVEDRIVQLLVALLQADRRTAETATPEAQAKER